MAEALFDAKDKGRGAIVEADGARCMGEEGDEHLWSVACGKPIGSGGEGRIAVKATKAYGASIGVLSSTASRESLPGGRTGGIGLDSDGMLLVNGNPVRTVNGFGDGDILRAAVLKAGGGRIVAFYVNEKEVARQPLPDDEYRFAVGGFDTAFEMVDAAAAAAFWTPEDWKAGRIEWSPQIHKDLPSPHRACAVSLMWLGQRLRHNALKQDNAHPPPPVWVSAEMVQVWMEVVLPLVLRQTEELLEALQVFLKKIRMPLDELKGAVKLQWTIRKLTSEDCKVIAYLASSGAMPNLETLKYAQPLTAVSNPTRLFSTVSSR